jgi:hypothetical protein
MAPDLRMLVWLFWGKDLAQKLQRKRRVGPARDPRYRAWIRTLPCAVCGARWRVEAAHTGYDGGMAQKSSDYSCVPLCRNCHTAGGEAYHRVGRREFEMLHSINLGGLARSLKAAWDVRFEATFGGESA